MFFFFIFDALKWLLFRMGLLILDHCTLLVATQISLLQSLFDSHALQFFGSLLQGQFLPLCSTWNKNISYLLNKIIEQTLFLKLVHTGSQVNHKTQLFWVGRVHQVLNGHTLAGLLSCHFCLATMATLRLGAVPKTKSCFPN